MFGVVSRVDIYHCGKGLTKPTIAGIRMRGKYSDCCKVFGKLFSKLFLRVIGKSMMLTYDTEYRENDADYEPCFPGNRVRELRKSTLEKSRPDAISPYLIGPLRSASKNL